MRAWGCLRGSSGWGLSSWSDAAGVVGRGEGHRGARRGEGFDLAIRAGVLPDSDHIARLLLPVTPLLCAAPDYLAARGAPADLDALRAHDLIGMRSTPSQRVFA